MTDLEKIKNGTVQVIPLEDLQKKLKKGKSLIIKLGVDPTSVDLHLGHTVVLEKLKEFQDLGHKVIFLIGDFTARIGDPTGKSKTRPPLTKEEIKKNAATYVEQVAKILDPKKIEIRFNSEWLDKLGIQDLIELCASVTVAQLIEREDFSRRLKEKQPISLHELLYPIMQGYDSVALKADVELGGTDQTFNLLMGRTLQEKYSQEPQIIITMPLLEGLDGVEKMSKSLGNAVGINEPAEQAFGKLMSISDDLMIRYYNLLLHKTDIDKNVHPMDLKKQMAFEIVKKFWSEKEAQEAKKQFEDLFQKKDYSAAHEIELPKNTENPIWIVDLLKILDAIKSSSDAKRLIESGAVKLNDSVINDFKLQIKWNSADILKVGKHKIYKLK
ncbi:tyrosine--tRNA ligase [candidate division TM6 bacterium RIFCSPHIGHO2_12_FULL_32_22]|nr:MAG: tyrosine--tRNA ligase [candidate division TM6 bacterium RIFCSPHIGHO2_12_FULL_32_22]